MYNTWIVLAVVPVTLEQTHTILFMYNIWIVLAVIPVFLKRTHTVLPMYNIWTVLAVIPIFIKQTHTVLFMYNTWIVLAIIPVPLKQILYCLCTTFGFYLLLVPLNKYCIVYVQHLDYTCCYTGSSTKTNTVLFIYNIWIVLAVILVPLLKQILYCLYTTFGLYLLLY